MVQSASGSLAVSGNTLPSKSCHVKNFGTRDLRSANLPHKENPASSPGRFTSSPPPGGEASLPRSLAVPTDTEEAEEERDTLNAIPSHSYAGILSNTGRSGYGGLPRTIPLSPTRRSRTIDPAEEQESTHYNAVPLGRSHSSATAYDNSPRPITQTSTGTRYGAALGSTSWVSSNTTGSPARKWGGTNPSCGRCGKSVFFAEQVDCFSSCAKIPMLISNAGQGGRKDISQGVFAVYRM